MDIQDFRKLLETNNDKFSIFANIEILRKYNFNAVELAQAIKDFLSDEEKAKLFELEHFKKLSPRINYLILKTITDSKIKLQILKTSHIVDGFQSYEIKDLIKSLDSSSKLQIIHDLTFFKEQKIDNFFIQNLIEGLDSKDKLQLLEDKNFVQNELHLNNYDIQKLIKGLESDETKTKIIEEYQLDKYLVVEILKKYSNKNKIDIILNKQFAQNYQLDKLELEKLISSLDIDVLEHFLKEQKDFLQSNDIKIYSIINSLNEEQQLEFLTEFENLGLTLDEKRQILVILKDEAKERLDKSKLPQEYLTALGMHVQNDFGNISTFGKIIPDLNKDLTIYQGLDELLYLRPMEVTEEQNKKIIELCKICPSIMIRDSLNMSLSTSKEYISGESWISSVFQGMDKKWTNIQKVAYIDNAIGKKISYSPDFDTEVFNASGARTLWKIIDSGYGVCNGISQVEKYIFDKIGIESEIVSSGVHSFLKLKNIELPCADGTVKVGDTILDPTWNLMAQRFGAKPVNFCKSYEEIRKHDIDYRGIDRECHKNDEKLSSATLELDEQSLRDVYRSIGITDKEGYFPIQTLIENCKKIDDCKYPESEAIKKQFKVLKEYYPDFAKCQNSTMGILESIVLNQENFRFNRCVVNRVYEKKDENKRPILYVYVDLPDVGEKFYYVDENLGEFVETPQKEFEARFECYEKDLQKSEGHRPWEMEETPKKTENLEQSSGKIITQNDEER